jgi:hypothetical protein
MASEWQFSKYIHLECVCCTVEPREIFGCIICECRIRNHNGLIVLLLRKCLGGCSVLWCSRIGTMREFGGNFRSPFVAITR